MAKLIDRVRKWASELPYWEQAALEKLVQGERLTSADFSELVGFFFQDAGLMPKTARPTLAFPSAAEPTPRSCRLEKLENLTNVNNLPTGQVLTFGPQLTIVYGANGSGKSGYTRPLSAAAFSRSDLDVLPNARKAEDPQSKPKATIEVSIGNSKSLINWERGIRCPELATFSVFDGDSLGIHLTRSNSITCAPGILGLLTDLAEITDQVRDRVKAIVGSRDNPNTFPSHFHGTSDISAIIANLGPETDLTALERLALLSEADRTRMSDLASQIQQLSAEDLAKQVTILSREIQELQNLTAALNNLKRQLDQPVLEENNTLVDSILRAQEDARQSGIEQFRTPGLTEVGTDIWRGFLRAAHAVALAEGRRGVQYPTEADICLLCRQPLSTEAIHHMERLWGFLGSDASARLQTLTRFLDQKVNGLRALGLSFFDNGTSARQTVDDTSPETSRVVQDWLRIATVRRDELIESLQSLNKLPATSLPDLDLYGLAGLVARKEEGRARLQSNQTAQRLGELEKELTAFSHRQTLATILPDIRSFVSGKRWVREARQRMGNTRHITDKYNELFTESVTDQYRAKFEELLKRFKRDLKVTVETRGQKAEAVRQLVLSPETFLTPMPIDRVLSDGEKRVVALVDFLTEVSLDDRNSGIILDDPVTSLDLQWKETVATCLAEESQKRQVVVFTHDLMFIHSLRTKAKDLSVGIDGHWIVKEQDQIPQSASRRKQKRLQMR